MMGLICAGIGMGTFVLIIWSANRDIYFRTSIKPADHSARDELAKQFGMHGAESIDPLWSQNVYLPPDCSNVSNHSSCDGSGVL